MPDAYLDADEIRAATFVRHIEIHDTLGSTNDRAIELVRDAQIELPALIAARHQTSGRGRGQHTWWSADGALTFSILLNPATLGISTQNWPQLSLATAVAVCDALCDELNPKSEIRNPKLTNLAIKWPNDVMLDDRKVCGILIESPAGPALAKDRLIIGIGINVNNSWRHASSEAGLAGIAVRDVTGREHNPQQILVNFAGAFQHRLAQLASVDPALPSAWRHRCWLRAKDVVIETELRSVAGRCQGIADDGALRIQSNTTTEHFFSGSVRLC